MLSWGLRFHPWPRRLLTVGLWFGQRGTVLVGSALLAGVVAWRARAVEPVVRLIVAVVTLGIVVYGFKLGLARNAPIGDALGQRPGTGASFPSGHTANAVLLWGLAQFTAVRWNVAERLTACIRVGRWLAPWVVSAVMILLDYHWVSDLIAGAAVGVALLWLTLLPAWARVSRLIDRRLTTRASTR